MCFRSVCACVPVFQMGSSMWEGKKHDTCFCQSADCSVTVEASFAPSCSAISRFTICPNLSRDKSRFPLLLPEVQAQTLQAAAHDSLEAIHLPKRPPHAHISPPHPAPAAHPVARPLPGWPLPLSFMKQEMAEFLDNSTSHLKGRKERVRCYRRRGPTLKPWGRGC